jgi:hypothetical protein
MNTLPRIYRWTLAETLLQVCVTTAQHQSRSKRQYPIEAWMGREIDIDGATAGVRRAIYAATAKWNAEMNVIRRMPARHIPRPNEGSGM